MQIAKIIVNDTEITQKVCDELDIKVFESDLLRYRNNPDSPEFKNICLNINSLTKEARGWKYSRSVNTEKQHASLSITADTLDEMLEKAKEFKSVFDDIDSKSQRVEFLNWYKTNRRAIKRNNLSIRSFNKKQSVLLANGHNVILTFKTKEEASEAALKIYGIIGTMPTIVES